MKPRSHPLTPEESALVLEAWEFAYLSLRNVKKKYKDLASDIESEFTYQLCVGIHRWNRKVSLYWWSIWRLRLAITVVFSRLPGGSRDRPTLAGATLHPIQMAVNKASERSPESFDLALEDITCNLSKSAAEVVRLLAMDHTTASAGRVLGLNSSAVCKRLRRAKPAILEALT